MKLLLISLALAASCATALTECRSVPKLDDTCDLEVVPDQKVLTLLGLNKMCGMMFAAHVYTKHYDSIKTQIHAFCDATSDEKCCPTATLGIVSTAQGCSKEKGKETKSCESGDQRGKPDTSGSFNAWVAYSTNSAGSKDLKAFFGCDKTCGKLIIAKLKAYTAGSGIDSLVTTLLAEFEGNKNTTVPSIYPPQTSYQGKLYDGNCGKETAKAQSNICDCRLESTAVSDKPAFCNQTFPETTTTTPTTSTTTKSGATTPKSGDPTGNKEGTTIGTLSQSSVTGTGVSLLLVAAAAQFW